MRPPGPRSRGPEFSLYHSISNLSIGKMNKFLVLKNPGIVHFVQIEKTFKKLLTFALYWCIIITERGENPTDERIK